MPKLYKYKYPRPALTVDGVVFGLDMEKGLKLLLIERKKDPFKGQWALPGGFVDRMDESVDDAIRRELEEETNVTGLYLEQLYTFGAPDRDPRERVVSVAYYALVKPSDLNVQAGSDAQKAKWFSVKRLPPLAFDHRNIVKVGLERVRAKVRYQPIGFELLPEKFTLRQLQTMYEHILGRELDKRNFRKKFLSLGVLTEHDEYVSSDVGGRRAQLYSFDRTKYRALTRQGFNFEV